MKKEKDILIRIDLDLKKKGFDKPLFGGEGEHILINNLGYDYED